jgi:predicted CxxxxCH...CXXCH cytochrome family protein
MDGDGKAEVIFSKVAGMASSFDANAGTCTTWCHGSAAFGGKNPTPLWTKVDGSQASCGSCHGAPPPTPHPQDTNCASCHPTMNPGSMTFLDPSRHIDGTIDVIGGSNGGGCSSCHGSADNSAPPKDLSGDTARSAQSVGAHQVHLGTSPWRRAMPCSSCHVVPTQTDSPGHRDGDNVAEVKFDTMNPLGTYTVSNATCSNNYCHGTGRGSTGTALWTAVVAMTCTSCHQTNGTGMSGDHRKHIREEGIRCSQCHGDVIDANQTIVNANLHVNGVHEVKMAQGTYNPATRACTNIACHDPEKW